MLKADTDTWFRRLKTQVENFSIGMFVYASLDQSKHPSILSLAMVHMPHLNKECFLGSLHYMDVLGSTISGVFYLGCSKPFPTSSVAFLNVLSPYLQLAQLSLSFCK